MQKKRQHMKKTTISHATLFPKTITNCSTLILKEKTRVHSMKSSPHPCKNLRALPRLKVRPGMPSSMYRMAFSALVVVQKVTNSKVAKVSPWMKSRSKWSLLQFKSSGLGLTSKFSKVIESHQKEKRKVPGPIRDALTWLTRWLLPEM